jgi:uncharacterized radical SAM superfamily Fe-S cluster-containing enzyme
MNYQKLFKCCIYYHNTPQERQIPFCDYHADKHAELNFKPKELKIFQEFLNELEERIQFE